ncbi:hypothetical protein ACWWD9_08145 [Methylovorus sp. SPW-M1]
MTPVYSPQTESEAVVISSMLDAHGIHFYLRGGAFSKLYAGMHINHYNTQMFMVLPQDYAFARELLAEFIASPKSEEASQETTIWYQLRVILELLYGGWCVPGKRWRKSHVIQDQSDIES